MCIALLLKINDPWNETCRVSFKYELRIWIDFWLAKGFFSLVL